MENKQKYIKRFKKAHNFKNWVIRLQTNYMFSFDPNGQGMYELNKLFNEFGTTDPDKLVEIIYK